MATEVSISNKFADAFTINSFMNKWSAIALGARNTTSKFHLQQFDLDLTVTDHKITDRGEFGVTSSLYPPQYFLNASKPVLELIQGRKCVTRRFVFDASGISALKLKAASTSVPNPTRIEVVSALIWKCVMEARRANLGSIRPSEWRQIVNQRRRSAGQTENVLGNFVWLFDAKTEECKVDLQNLVGTLRKYTDDYQVSYPNRITAEDICQKIKDSEIKFGKEGIDHFCCTSLLRVPFYETNFGWGKPSWVFCYVASSENLVSLMDASDGSGIEACLTFLEEDMAIVESNQELLAYASHNPSVIFRSSQSQSFVRSEIVSLL